MNDKSPDLTVQEKLWNEHALAIGRIALAWNTLQETLAEIFADLFDRKDWQLAINLHLCDVNRRVSELPLRLCGGDSSFLLELSRQALGGIKLMREMGLEPAYPSYCYSRQSRTLHKYPRLRRYRARYRAL